MKAKQKKEFIVWLGHMYLDFDNENDSYCEITSKEIKNKLDTYDRK